LTNFISPYLNIAIFENDSLQAKNTFSSLNQADADNQVRIYSNKLNNFISEISQFIDLLLGYNNSEQRVFEYFYDLVNINTEKVKMYSNPYNSSSNGKICLFKYLLRLYNEYCFCFTGNIL
jgi:hypothetical protein